MSPLRAWLLACRPRTLTAAFAPVAVGSACAHAAGGFRAGPALAALFGAIFIQIGTNLANDVYDAEQGADTADRVGPTRVVQAGLLGARQVKRGTLVAFALAAACGVYLALVAGPWVVAIGLASIAAGLGYTAGPFPLGYHGLGDLFVLLFFGFVAVCGTAFVQLGFVPCAALFASVPVGALATAILVVNNVRDRATDAVAGKRTLAVRFGRRAALIEYALLIAAAYAVPAATGHLLPLASLPFALFLVVRLVRADGGPPHNRLLAATAQLLLLHGSLYTVDLWFR
ncbi:MAG: 1,4-dihydroxy-2-naphthoate polyprenyltransferase [Myxococcales bacterium]|nr:1,4-dihydroxy-2-naphthoate polyprenyltransferase [Myxococcales bacterium]